MKKNCKGDECSPNETRLINMLKKGLNIIIFALILALFMIIVKELISLFTGLFNSGIKLAVDQILFILILIELYTILISYLKKGYIKVERIIEVGIISMVRELIFHFLDVDIYRIYALAAVLLVLGGIFWVEKGFSKERNV